MACEAPFDPTGYIGCAASPSSVTRPLGPVRQRIAVAGRVFVEFGRRRNQAAARRHGAPRTARHAASVPRACRAATSPRGGAAARCLRRPSPAPPSWSDGSPGSILPRSDRPRPWHAGRRRRSSNGRSGTPASRARRATASARSSTAALHPETASRAPSNGCRRRRSGYRRARSWCALPARSKK